jgi:hypothetical protein
MVLVVGDILAVQCTAQAEDRDGDAEMWRLGGNIFHSSSDTYSPVISSEGVEPLQLQAMTNQKFTTVPTLIVSLFVSCWI